MWKTTLIFFFIFITALWAYEQQPTTPIDNHVTSCITPNNDQGMCINMRQCSIFINGIITGKRDNFDFIRESHCGYQNEDPNLPKVCCGLHSDYLFKMKPTETNEDGKAKRDPFPQFCGNQSEEVGNTIVDKVVGGVAASIGEFPWMARLRHIRSSDGYQQFGCAGFLISKNFVLTAAHCIRSTKMLSTFGPIHQVVLGEHYIENHPDCRTEEMYCANQVQYLKTGTPIVHPEYLGDDNYHNDIAIIPLEDPAQFSPYVYPICLSRTRSQESAMWVSGWGKTEYADSSDVKLKLVMPRVNTTECASLYGRIGIQILDKQICAGGIYGHDTCVGDSGGPIMVTKSDHRWYAEGIVSFGKSCGEKGWPGVYTSVPQYISWIEQYLESGED